MDKEKVEISASGIEKLLTQTLGNLQEERDLALDRYRRQDEMIVSPEDFVLQGKNAVEYLKTAADRSNTMLDAVKLMKDIVYKDSSNGNGGGNGGSMNDETKKELMKMVRETK